MQPRQQKQTSITRTPVDSSNLASVGYDPKLKVLEVEFHSGAVYQYFGVELKIYDQLMYAHSKGQYFNRNIRQQNYKYTRTS